MTGFAGELLDKINKINGIGGSETGDLKTGDCSSLE
jgi:hypothetical protein